MAFIIFTEKQKICYDKFEIFFKFHKKYAYVFFQVGTGFDDNISVNFFMEITVKHNNYHTSYMFRSIMTILKSSRARLCVM